MAGARASGRGVVLRSDRTRRRAAVVALVAVLIAAGATALVLLRPPAFADALPAASSPTGSPAPPPADLEPTAPTTTSPPGFDRTRLSIDDPASPWVVVDKLRPLAPLDYAPSDLVDAGGGHQLRAEAAQAMAAMQAAASAAGLRITVESAYRSYEYQQGLFGNAVARFGQEGAERRSARPGYSEHQTGLAADLGGGGCDIETCFADTAEGQWVVANGPRFGFVIRYPDGSQPVTGYKFEPWHVRYVGVELATEMQAEGVATLEEFFGLPAAPEYA
jgi:D-alanyl-D-alanine carboxypeptidase